MHCVPVSDLLLMFTSWESIGEKYFVIHHFAALYAYYYVLSQGILPYFANFRLLSEFSTPFVNQRWVICRNASNKSQVTRSNFHILLSSWFFHMLGYHKLSKPSLLNGVAMAFTFFLVRIAVIPGYYSHMYSVFGTDDFYRLPIGARCAWVISSVSLDVMNIMWMRRIIRGCLKVLRSAWTRPAGTDMETRKKDWHGVKDRNNTSAHKPSILSIMMLECNCHMRYSSCCTFEYLNRPINCVESHWVNNDLYDVIFKSVSHSF